ncbi:hypothetical protein UM93_13320 [Psychromicrobium lacuslunae]|uniref:LytR/CpsA/Psr regulator C-terminal domain-containing protein n=1 Tax=Psychromicrobium lacuslunae TaxID=1618207 RepID=A0A0D4C0N0_9MICC|nr:hypothetical protein UM93_13320 [Psychromicrobium lacuslunae]
MLIFLSLSVLLAAGLAAAVGLGISNALPGRPTQSASCPTEPIASLQAAEVSVNVYNSTSTSGLAAKTAKQLKELGIKVLLIGNKPVPPVANRPQPQVVLSGSSVQLSSLATVQGFFPQAGVLLTASKSSAIDVYLIGTKPALAAGQQRVKLQCLRAAAD